MATRVEHRYQGFKTLEEAKAFDRGVLLTPKSRGKLRREYNVLAGCYLDTKVYPYIRVWNQRVEE